MFSLTFANIFAWCLLSSHFLILTKCWRLTWDGLASDPGGWMILSRAYSHFHSMMCLTTTPPGHHSRPSHVWPPSISSYFPESSLEPIYISRRMKIFSGPKHNICDPPRSWPSINPPPLSLNTIEDEISPNNVDIITVKGWVALILASYHPTYISVQVKPLNVILQQGTQSYNDHKDCNILNHILHP